MLNALQKRWFLIALFSLIGAGLYLGSHDSADVARVLDTIFAGPLKSWIVAAVLFLMSVTLESRHFRRAILSPLPVVVAIVINIGLLPPAAALFMRWQTSPDFAVGLLIACSVPCTLAASSVWTRRGGGNDAVSLLVTIITNGLCFLFTPFWLGLFVSESVELDAVQMVWRLALTALLPISIGQMLRVFPLVVSLTARHKTPLGVVAQMAILLIVFDSACDAGGRLNGNGTSAGGAPDLLAVATVTISSCLLHVGAMGLAILTGRVLRLSRYDLIAVAFSSSQKTLPIGVLIATDDSTFGTLYPWAVFPMLIFHACQLFIDTSVADHFRGKAPTPVAASPPEST